MGGRIILRTPIEVPELPREVWLAPEIVVHGTHPGWEINSIGVNVCTRCGKPKAHVLNRPCEAP